MKAESQIDGIRKSQNPEPRFLNRASILERFIFRLQAYNAAIDGQPCPLGCGLKG